MTYIVFLRGINVNGIKIKMIEVKKAFEEMGFGSVETILATGNIILEHDEMPISQLKGNIEAYLSKAFKYEAHVIVKTKFEIEKMLKIDYVKNDQIQHYIILTEHHEIHEAIELAYQALKDENLEKLYLIEDYFHWEVEKGFTLKTDFGKKLLGSKTFKSELTTRNIGTIQKIHDKLV